MRRDGAGQDRTGKDKAGQDWTGQTNREGYAHMLILVNIGILTTLTC